MGKVSGELGQQDSSKFIRERKSKQVTEDKEGAVGRFEWNQKEHDVGLNTHFNTYRMTLVKSINFSKILTPIKMEKVICALWFDMEVNTHALSAGNTISPPFHTVS